MILEMDCGNTRVKWRVRDKEVIFTSGIFLTADAFGQSVFDKSPGIEIKRVLISSVLGDDFNKKIISWSLAQFNLNPEFAFSEPYSNGISNGYQEPEKLGVDRWLGVIAAKAKTENAYVVVDCGSAITVDVVTASGEHLGGYIAPGLGLMRDILGQRTVAIKLGQIGYPNDPFPGRNTVVAIKAAELAMITGLIEQAISVLKHYQTIAPDIFITGGDGLWLNSIFESAIFHEDLVLDGLRITLNAP